MDLHNLATVITPNILYSKSKDPTKDESFLAIEAVMGLLEYQDDFCVVSYPPFLTVSVQRMRVTFIPISSIHLILNMFISVEYDIGANGFVVDFE